MNILYICPRFPYPADQGDKVVIYSHLKFLSKENKITLLSFIQDEKELENISYLSGYCAKIEVFKKRANLSVVNLITAMYKTDPFTVIRYYSPEMFKRSKALIESGGFDAVHVAFYYMGQYAVNKSISIPRKTAVILDTHNIEYLIYSRYAQLAKNPFVRLFIRLESLRIKRYELHMYKKFDRCIAFSELDRNNIARLSGASNVEVNPACIELPAGQDFQRGTGSAEPAGTSPDTCEEADSMLFFGLLNTPANDDAVRFFYKKIFPLVKLKRPGAKFIIAGKNPGRYITHLSKDPGVRLLGLVADIRGLLKRTALVIVPLRLGGGIRIKILESWAMRKAVVSTSIGAEGIDAQGGSDIIIADSASDFADSVAALLNDYRKRIEIGQAAFKKASEYYRPERIIKNLEAVYKTVLQERAVTYDR